MKKIILEEALKKEASKVAKKKLHAEESILSQLWRKCNVFVGYVVAISLAVVFLVCWPFNWYIFALSLMWGISFLRLRVGTIMITKMSVVIMWCIFCFGTVGIVMQLLKLDGDLALSGLIAGFGATVLYCCIPLWSAFLKYKKFETGYTNGNETKYNGGLFSMSLVCVTLFIIMINDAEVQTARENQHLDQILCKIQFEPVKLIKEEIFDGHTVYILETDGKQFAISPFEYPEVRKLNENSQVKVILGGIDEHHLKIVKKIQFKN